MIGYKSEEIAERNQEGFNAALAQLRERRGGGIEYYEIRSSGFIEYDPVENKFFRSVDLGGSRRHSLCGKDYLSDSETDELYRDVGLGVVDVYIMPCRDEHSPGTRFWKGEFNIREKSRRIPA